MIFHSTLRQPSDYFPITHSALATQRFGKTMTSRRAPKKSARIGTNLAQPSDSRCTAGEQNGGNV
jgi:hypothetical protein